MHIFNKLGIFFDTVFFSNGNVGIIIILKIREIKRDDTHFPIRIILTNPLEEKHISITSKWNSI